MQLGAFPMERASCLRLEDAGRCRAADPRSAQLGRARSACPATHLPHYPSLARMNWMGFPRPTPSTTGCLSSSHASFSSPIPNKPRHASLQLPVFGTGGSREAGSWGQADQVPKVLPAPREGNAQPLCRSRGPSAQF